MTSFRICSGCGERQLGNSYAHTQTSQFLTLAVDGRRVSSACGFGALGNCCGDALGEDGAVAAGHLQNNRQGFGAGFEIDAGPIEASEADVVFFSCDKCCAFICGSRDQVFGGLIGQRLMIIECDALDDVGAEALKRSEERRVGKEC